MKMPEIKKLGFGLMRLPYSESEQWGHVDLEKTRQMIDAYMAEGFSYLFFSCFFPSFFPPSFL